MERKDLIEKESLRTQLESLKLSQEISDFISKMDPTSKTDLSHLRDLILRQSHTLSPIEKMAMDPGDLRMIADSLLSDDIESVYKSLITNLKVVGKHILNLR